MANLHNYGVRMIANFRFWLVAFTVFMTYNLHASLQSNDDLDIIVISRAAHNDQLAKANEYCIYSIIESIRKINQSLPLILSIKQVSDLQLFEKMIVLNTKKHLRQYEIWRQSNSLEDRENGRDSLVIFQDNQFLIEWSVWINKYVTLLEQLQLDGYDELTHDIFVLKNSYKSLKFLSE